MGFGGAVDEDVSADAVLREEALGEVPGEVAEAVDGRAEAGDDLEERAGWHRF